MKIIICSTCGAGFSVADRRANTAKYCSVACMATGYKGKPPAYTPPRKRVQLTCAHCGKSFEQIASRLKHGRGVHCSKACQYAAIAARDFGSEQRTCFNCGKEFAVWQSRLAGHKGAGKYCSRPCRDAHRHGLNHPQYLNGEAQEKRGPNWQAQRRKALKRDDYTCQHCSGPGGDVHHVKPFRLFGLERYTEANDLTNLVTLCHRCHRIADAAIQRGA